MEVGVTGRNIPLVTKKVMVGLCINIFELATFIQAQIYVYIQSFNQKVCA